MLYWCDYEWCYVSLCYFFPWSLLPAFPESWHCHPSGCGLCAKPGGSNLNGNQGGLVSPASLPHPSMSTHARFLNEKNPIKLVFTSEVPRAHVFWMEKPGDGIWWGPKSPGKPFYPPLLLQNCCCCSSSTLVQRLAGTRTYPVWQQSFWRGWLEEKAITFYVLSSPLLSFHYPINLNRE